MTDISIERKKKIIVENAGILNRDIKITILSLIMMEAGSSVIMETSNKKDVDINLDKLQLKNEELLNHIYNIVKKRIDTLSQPVKQNVY